MKKSGAPGVPLVGVILRRGWRLWSLRQLRGRCAGARGRAPHHGDWRCSTARPAGSVPYAYVVRRDGLFRQGASGRYLASSCSHLQDFIYHLV